MVERKVIQTDEAPAAIGPYSQGLLAGNLLFVSGQLGIVPETGQLVEGGTTAQARQALENVMAILAKAALSLRDVVQVQVFLTDMGDFKAVNEVYKTFFQEPYPARAAIQVGALPAGGSVEVLVTAVRG
jgi:2-iminobutanoate/2-iminopropanoate deaminase